MRLLALAALTLISVQPLHAQDGPGAAVASTFARPAIQMLVDATSRGVETIDALCRAPSDASLDLARRSFSDMVGAFGRVSVLRFGPLAAESRFEHLFFWPDPRGIGLRQIQGALAEQDPTLTDSVALSGKSAALQGLPALEFVLSGTGAEQLAGDDGAYRCNVALALSRHVRSMAADVLAGWQDGSDFASSLAAPAPRHRLYRSVQEVNGEVVKALSTILQFVRAAELQPPFGATEDKANGRRAPFWRSDLTFAFIQAQLEGAKALLEAADFEDALADDQKFVVGSLNFEIGTASRQLAAVETPAEAAFAYAEARGHIGVALLALEHADELVADNLSVGLGLTMGFNALDGD